jgi:hypothetical protein
MVTGTGVGAADAERAVPIAKRATIQSISDIL